MKAAYINETGPAENIIYGDLPDPVPGPGQVLVKVGAVALNPVDTYIRNGANYWELPRPFIVGCDVAGEVAAVGPGADRFRVGDRVWGSNQGLLGRQGTFAQWCAVDQQWLYPTPDGVDDETAAACALVGITAHLGLFRDARLQAGESLVVTGGTGGVGSMVVQMAKLTGARVLCTAGSEAKMEAASKLGADAVVNYHTTSLPDAVREFAPDGANVYWETTREPNFQQIVDCLGERGRIVLMAGREATPPFPVGPFYVKGCSMFGFVMFKATADEQQQCADAINQWLASGKLAANISQVLPLAEAAAAHRLQEQNTLEHAGSLAGKIVLKP